MTPGGIVLARPASVKFSRIRWFWSVLRSSLWFVPAIMTIGALLAVWITNYIDRHYRFDIAETFVFFYHGGPEGARHILSTIAGSMITVAGVIFSITIVALSLASQQFGPRVLRNYMRDRANQLVLGTFIATFIYCLLVLPSIRGTEDSAFVPNVSVTFGVGLAFASLAVLIYFIHHVSRSIQADVIVRVVSRDLDSSIEHIYPEHLAWKEGDEDRGRKAFDIVRTTSHLEIEADKSGYVQFVNQSVLMDLCCGSGMVAEILRRPGDFVAEGTPVARIWARSGLDEEKLQKLADAFVIGTSRTTDQDVEFAILQLVEIAVRSLSPGINDPFTAVACVDRISQGLTKLVNRDFPSPYHFDDDGELRLVARPFDFAGVCDTAFDQIRQYGASSVAVTIRLLERIADIMDRCDRPDRREMLLEHARMIRRAGERCHTEKNDLRDMKERFDRVVEAAEA